MTLRVWCNACGAQSIDPATCFRDGCPYSANEDDAVEAQRLQDLLDEGYTPEDARAILNGAKPGVSFSLLRTLLCIVFWLGVLAISADVLFNAVRPH